MPRDFNSRPSLLRLAASVRSCSSDLRSLRGRGLQLITIPTAPRLLAASAISSVEAMVFSASWSSCTPPPLYAIEQRSLYCFIRATVLSFKSPCKKLLISSTQWYAAFLNVLYVSCSPLIGIILLGLD